MSDVISSHTGHSVTCAGVGAGAGADTGAGAGVSAGAGAGDSDGADAGSGAGAGAANGSFAAALAGRFERDANFDVLARFNGCSAGTATDGAGVIISR